MLCAQFACFSTHCKIRTDAPQPLLQQAVNTCARLQNRWSFYDENSALSALNRGAPMPLEPAERAIVALLLRLFARENGDWGLENQGCASVCGSKNGDFGVFNPAVGAAKKGAAVDLSRQHFWLENGILHSDCALDFGGVMKEAAVDLCAQILADYKFIINFGGDIRTNSLINILIKNPQNPSTAIARVQLARGGALCTSALYERGAHIIGANGRLMSATVCAQNARDFGESDGEKTSAAVGKNPHDFGESDGEKTSADEEFLCLRCGLHSSSAMMGHYALPRGFGALFIDAANAICPRGEIDFCPLI